MISKRTTITGQIETLIEELDGTPICDDCITDRLNLSVRSQANVVTRVLGGNSGYHRERRPCGSCARIKAAISRGP